MRKLTSILFLSIILFSCGGNTENKQIESQPQEQVVSTANDSIISVYYFHGKQRCKTCLAIEDVAKTTIADNYNDNPKIRFVDINIEKDENKDIVEKYEIAFSSLLIVKGEDYTDLTEQAFSNAVNSPDILTGYIKEEINKRID